MSLYADIKGVWRKVPKPRWALPDPTPASVHVPLKVRDITAETARAAINLMSQRARINGDETIEESEDFDVGEGGSIFDFPTRYEVDMDRAIAVDKLKLENAELSRQRSFWSKFRSAKRKPTPPTGGVDLKAGAAQ